MNDPNPQPIDAAPYETLTIAVTMDVVGSVSGGTFILNIRNDAGVLALQVNGTISVTGDATTYAVVNFVVTSNQTGVTLGLGDFKYDAWRTDTGNEKQLARGTFVLREQEWQ